MFIRFCIKLVPILFIYCSYGNTTDSLKLYSDLGLQSKKQGNLMLSEQHYKKAIQFANSEIVKAGLLSNLGAVYIKQGKYDSALNSYLRAEKISKNTSNIIKAYANMSIIYQLKGDFKKAILYNEKALNLVTSKKWKASILNNMANIFYTIKDYKRALIYYEHSFKIKKEFDLKSISYLNLALCLEALNRNKEAEDYFIKTINKRRKIYGEKDYHLILAYTNYGLFLIEKNPEKALEALLNANYLAILNYGKKHPETIKTLISLGKYYSSKKKYSETLKYYQKALVANSKDFNDTSYFLNSDLSKAISKLQQLEILHNKAIALRKYAGTLNEDKKVLGVSLATYELAIQSLFKLQNSFMDDSKRTLIANKKDMFAEAAYVAIQLNDYPKAFQLIEKGKASTLLAAMNNNDAIKYSDIPDSLVGLENEYKRLQFVHSANDNTDSVLFYQAKHDSLVSYFETNYKKYYNLKYGGEFPDPCKQLDTNHVLLEYALTDTLCTTIVVTNDGYKHHSFSIDSAFYKEIETFIFLQKDFIKHKLYIEQYKQNTSIGYSLWEKLIKPLNIPEGKSLIIVPDGILSYLPFDALLYKQPPPDNIHYYKLDYLVYKYPISYNYSANWLFEPFTGNPTKNIGAFALDYQETDSLMLLLNTIPIANEITRYFQGESYLNEDCTKDNFFKHAEKYKILHFGMHGDIIKGNKTDFKLMFHNKALHSWEVYGMNLNARLAYLCACNTGDGKLDAGEGVFSMARAFAYAGCGTVIASLWTEKDNVSQITSDFYKGLKKGQSLDIAMQQAKIKYIKGEDRAHPHYWANKIVIGKTAPIKKQLNYWLFLFVSIIVLIPVIIKLIIKFFY